MSSARRSARQRVAEAVIPLVCESVEVDHWLPLEVSESAEGMSDGLGDDDEAVAVILGVLDDRPGGPEMKCRDE